MERLIEAVREAILGGWTAADVRDYFTPDQTQSPHDITVALREAVKRGILKDEETALFV